MCTSHVLAPAWVYSPRLCATSLTLARAWVYSPRASAPFFRQAPSAALGHTASAVSSIIAPVGAPLSLGFLSGHTVTASWAHCNCTGGCALVPLLPSLVPLLPSLVHLLPCLVPLLPCLVPLLPVLRPRSRCALVPLLPCSLSSETCSSSVSVSLLPCSSSSESSSLGTL